MSKTGKLHDGEWQTTAHYYPPATLHGSSPYPGFVPLPPVRKVLGFGNLGMVEGWHARGFVFGTYVNLEYENPWFGLFLWGEV